MFYGAALTAAAGVAVMAYSVVCMDRHRRTICIALALAGLCLLLAGVLRL